MHDVASLDISSLLYINGFVGHSALLDKTMMKINDLSLLKTGLFASYFYYVWFRREDWAHDRRFVLRALLGVAIAIAVSRAMQELLPARVRPMFEPSLHLMLPTGLHTELLFDANSFPSDTTALATALATAIVMDSRLFGLLAAFIVVTTSVATKLYLAYHYPSDILGGILVGVLSMIAAQRLYISDAVWRGVMRIHDAYRGLFYALMFLGVWQLATLFNDLRLIGRGVLEVLGVAAGHL
jgi:undecaprenyl-diphosphatase